MISKLIKIKGISSFVILGFILGVSFLGFSSKNASAATPGSVDCSAAELKDLRDNTLLGLPAWYKYLPAERVSIVDINNPDPTGAGKTVCQPVVRAVNDADGNQETLPVTHILLILAAVLEMLVRVAGLAAFIYLIYGGFMYLTSSGNSEMTKKAGATLLNAAIGLAIAISATAIVQFIATRLSA